MTATGVGSELSRRTVLKAAGVLGLGGVGIADRTRAQESVIPTEPTLYRLRMVGETSFEAFDRDGQFFVTPPVGQTSAGPRDVAIISGNPLGAPESGAIAFYTNTALRTALNTGGDPTLNDAAVPIGSVQTDDASGLLRAEHIADLGVDLPPGVSAGLQVNIFTPRGGIVAPLYEIGGGVVDVQFHSGNQIEGAMEFVGTSLGGAADQGSMVAQFAGTA
ncbi:hypothetical protein [Natronorubrum texcoconense]|uniref:Uncharacterized protein n=1 Tax=Natronorubrum texcoconense TaxID=1095776 RepID=A0A1G8SX33_9EURY|nr:hypothetical protein [Natronorubrum texcoconense]SDJ33832.1 hypothetical protein SAMN04515672_0233 [Natronorubrum texcoconense]